MASMRLALASAAWLVALVSQAMAQDYEELAKEAQNPIADLISVPFQNNTNFNVGRLDNDQNILNFQPVIPFKLNENWNLITRWILPIVYQPPLFPGDSTDFGLGNFNPSFFFATTAGSNITWGVGPTLLLPTSTTGVSVLTSGAPDRQA